MISLEDVLADQSFNFLELVNRPSSLQQAVVGINRVENQHVLRFIKPNELIIILYNEETLSERQLLTLIKKLVAHTNITAVVLTSNQSERVRTQGIIELGDALDLPILLLPWSIRIADFTHSLTAVLIQKEKEKESMAAFVKKGTQTNFSDERLIQEAQQLLHLEDNDYLSILLIGSPLVNGQRPKKEISQVRQALARQGIIFINGTYKQSELFVIKEAHDSLSTSYQYIQNYLQGEEPKPQLYASMGRKYPFNKLAVSLKEAKQVDYFNRLKNHQTFLSYDELGIYRFLLEISDRQVLIALHQGVLGDLKRYDKLKNKDYLPFLKLYFEESGNVEQVAKRAFLHRNTVIYRMNRIQSLLAIDFSDFKGVALVALALAIEELPNFSYHADKSSIHSPEDD